MLQNEPGSGRPRRLEIRRIHPHFAEFWLASFLRKVSPHAKSNTQTIQFIASGRETAFGAFELVPMETAPERRELMGEEFLRELVGFTHSCPGLRGRRTIVVKEWQNKGVEDALMRAPLSAEADPL